MRKKGVVSRAKTGKIISCTKKKEYIEREVAYHLGILKPKFESGVLDED